MRDERKREAVLEIDHQIEKARALSRIIKNESTPKKITGRGRNTEDEMMKVTPEKI